MRVALPELLLALKSASKGVGKGNHWACQAALMRAATGVLHASMTDGRRLSVGRCSCAGDIIVAVDANRLRTFLEACEESEVAIEQMNGDAEIECGSLSARFAGFDLAQLPSHDSPSSGERRQMSGDLAALLKRIEAATRDAKLSGPGQITLMAEGGVSTVFGHVGSGLALWGAIDEPGPEVFEAHVLPGTLAADAPQSGGTMLLGSKLGFLDEGSGVYEPAVDVTIGPKNRYSKLIESAPTEWSSFDAAALARALRAQAAFQYLSEDRKVLLRSSQGSIEARWRSSLGEFLAKLAFDGPEFEITISPALVMRVLPLLENSQLAHRDCQLWLRGGPFTAAVSGFYV